jgi:hypothetical protein
MASPSHACRSIQALVVALDGDGRRYQQCASNVIDAGDDPPSLMSANLSS